MAYIQDSTQSFTITLTALLEGRGILTIIDIKNVTTGLTYVWSLVNGWETDLPEATEGDSVYVRLDVRNDGDATDTLFSEFVSLLVTPAEPLIQEYVVPVGLAMEGYWTFTMPPNNVSITINAGHVE